jgi:glycosyl transferase family 4
MVNLFTVALQSLAFKRREGIGKKTFYYCFLMSSAVRILLVSHNFPPTAGPESALVRLNAAWMVRAGFDLRVLTTTSFHALQAMDVSLLTGLPTNLIVIRQPSPEAQLTEWFPKAGRWAAVMLGRKVLPEIFLPWALPATKAGCRLVRDWHPQLIYSRAPKHVSNVVGWRLKRKTGLPWLAHFSDPWITAGLPHQRLQRWIGLPLERRILRDADALVFVTQQAMDRVLKPYPASWRERARVIPHGYAEPSEVSDISVVRPPAAGPLTFIHAGAFYPGMRGPETLLAALQKLQAIAPLDGRLAIQCIGDDSLNYQPRAEAAGLAGVIRFLPSISFDECKARIASSHLSLIIDTPGYGGLFLPTKLFEAFGSKKAVLALTEPGSALAGILEQAEMPWADVKDPARIAEVIASLLDAWEKNQTAPSSGRPEVVASYEIDRVNMPLADLMNDLVAKAASL